MNNQSLPNLYDFVTECLHEPDVTPKEIVAQVRKAITDNMEYHQNQLQRSRETMEHLNSGERPNRPPTFNELYPREMDYMAHSDSLVEFANPAYWGNVIPGAESPDTISFAAAGSDTISFAAAESVTISGGAGQDTISLG